MSCYIDFERYSGAGIVGTAFDLLIIGSGVAGLTLARELSGQGLRLLIVESGNWDETTHEKARDATELQDDIGASGDSATARADELAQFGPIDLAQRDWVPGSGWPLDMDTLAHYCARAVRRLDGGPLLASNRIWKTTGQQVPSVIEGLDSFSPAFNQKAPSTADMTDAARLWNKFRSENHPDVTVLFNATATSIKCGDRNVTGVGVVSSVSGKNHCLLDAGYVVLAAGAVENARLLLLSRDRTGAAPGNRQDVVGRYLMDRPSVTLGSFYGPSKSRVASAFSAFTLFADRRAFIYSYGLSIKPNVQDQWRLTNMTVYATVHHGADDPVRALDRLLKGQRERRAADLLAASARPGLATTHVGRMLLEHPQAPAWLRGWLAHPTALLHPTSADRNRIRSPARKIEKVDLDVVCEQPPLPENRVTLSSHCDRFGLPKAKVTWDVGDQVRYGLSTLGSLLARELTVAGFSDFRLSPALAASDGAKIVPHNIGRFSGTTRMGVDVASSVVDPTSQVHGMNGLYVAGSSVFPTSGAANHAVMTMALSMRLADHLRERFASRRLAQFKSAFCENGSRPLVLVTGATGNLGTSIVEQLLVQGYRVRGQFHLKLPNESRVEWVHADFSKVDMVDATFDSLLNGVSAVIHLAATGPGAPDMHVTNEVNLERLVRACVRHGIEYFGHASSMVVYGSPTKRLVTESDPLINPDIPIEKQYFESGAMRDYARSKREAERVLEKYAPHLHVDVYRIAMAQRSLQRSLASGRPDRIMEMYRNNHYISPHNVAMAVVHLLQVALRGSSTNGIDAYNIADTASPSYKNFYHRVGHKALLQVPLAFDLLKGLALSRCISRRIPMALCRLDNSKLRSTGFELDSDRDSSFSIASPRHGTEDPSSCMR
ncbi:NAD-dependent epimerase/dehydratase family protein [Paraburkholderia sp. MMS20-SJTR3]|uniref:NAD-dependent epimerase/dehydratase family protein n=1 Tax=Paraburkholderia sejongensis TaxID=2886946 RepID=A0ABS8JTV8_9BURK|nr:GMC oxidoreductase [Paraburkholderia sp. MMS20-SJTR3]MCC8393180.1 NAD-dependent epimerase/dehydratase family protein [Paraburkholderia sp. MMS20-SJTR3]